MSIESFLKDRAYIANCRPATLAWYRACLKWLPNESPSQAEVTNAVIRMREAGKTPAGVNCTLRAIRAYLKFMGSPVSVPRLKEPVKLPSTFTDAQVRLLTSWRPSTRCQRRLHLIVLTLLDSGARIGEVLGLRVRDLDFDNLLVTLDGKTGQRIVPMSCELRRTLYRALKDSRPDDLVFATGSGCALRHRNVLRDVKTLCRTLGFDAPARTLHAMRHTFATHYAKTENAFMLQKVLGHRTGDMSRKYVHLSTGDLSAIHEKVTLLNKKL